MMPPMPVRPAPAPGGVLGISDDARPAHEPPVTAEEIRRWCWQREPHERERVPFIGERVLMRMDDWGPGIPAQVTGVQDMTVPNDGWGGPDADVHVWDADRRLLPDPWPWVTLLVEGVGEVRCKEARVRGGRGWLRPGSRWDRPYGGGS